MPKAYSGDLRERVIEAVAAGASRREAAERFEVSVASAVKWLQRWRDHNSATPKPRGGSVSPLEEFATEILAVIAKHPDRTLLETIAELRKRRIRTSRSSLWRFSRPPQHHPQKKPASCRTAASDAIEIPLVGCVAFQCTRQRRGCQRHQKWRGTRIRTSQARQSTKLHFGSSRTRIKLL